MESAEGFGWAIAQLKDGRRVSRKGWNGKGMCLLLVGERDYVIRLHGGFEVSGSLLPWIAMKTVDGRFVPWLASQTDVLAEDWVLSGYNP